ncbi:MAG: N-acetylmuramoyl-L-alanine amidase [Bacteroidia bacterium]|nr:N-acetylmuramoyl-L-alanine amidase [Bacteroidia bacterium]
MKFILSLRYCLIIATLALPNMALSQTSEHVQAQLQPGDGILSLLRRYAVDTKCNTAYFYRENRLKKNQGLVLHKNYSLPILVYQYNGRSIRSSTGINDFDWAVKVQQYNERMHSLGLKPGDYRVDNILWIPYHFLNCREEMQEEVIESIPIQAPGGPLVSKPITGTQIRGNYPILGPQYAEVRLESKSLEGFVYYVVAGHGGPDPGAVGDFMGHNLCEDEYAYDVALRLCRNLLAHGATVYMIIRDENDGIRSGEILPCDKDETCWLNQEIPISQSERLTQRSDAINLLYESNRAQGVRYQRLIVIHVDSGTQNQRVDMFFYHKIDDPESQLFASTLRGTIKQKYDEYRQGRGYEGKVSGRDLHMLRETLPPAVYIELGNIRNRNDQARLVIEGNRQLIANWLFEGIVKDGVKGN